MNFWNTKKLIEAFGEKSISERKKFQYYIFTLIATVVALEMPWWFPSEAPYNGFDLSLFFMFISITIIGNVLLFKANADNSDFIARVICLSVPITIKLMMVFVVILIPTVLVFDHLGWISEFGFSVQEYFALFSLQFIFEVAYFSLLSNAIKRVNEKIEAQKMNILVR